MLKRTKNIGHLRKPTREEVQECARRDYIDLSLAEAEAFIPSISRFLTLLDEVEELPELRVELKHLYRDPGHVPSGAEEDPYNSFTRICRVDGAQTGPLVGKRVAVKDNLAIAGIPTTNASRMASYVPTIDAVVIERLLDAGGTIVGKLNLDDWSFGSPVGYGASSFFGPPRNPHLPTHSAGGSSGGAGSAIASGAVDLALGVDQGGSARLPASYCGCVAIKATHGLVPSFGVTYFDHTLDSICPIAATVSDAALLLGVIAGDDWRDPQWVRGPILASNYLEAASAGVEGLRVGLVQETLDPERCDQGTLDGVERAGSALRNAGARVDIVSVPMWYPAWAVWVGVFLGGMPPMFRSDGVSSSHLGYVDVQRAHAFAVSRRQEADLFSSLIKVALITNSYVEKHYFSAVFGKAMNQRIVFTRELDKVLEHYDVLLTPTTPTTTTRLPAGRMTDVELMTGAVDQAPFTSPLNLSGHPAIAVPTGRDEEGLPTSVQIIARRFGEYQALAAAFALERLLDVKLGACPAKSN